MQIIWHRESSSIHGFYMVNFKTMVIEKNFTTLSALITTFHFGVGIGIIIQRLSQCRIDLGNFI